MSDEKNLTENSIIGRLQWKHPCSLQGGSLPVINVVITIYNPYKLPYKWVSGPPSRSYLAFGISTSLRDVDHALPYIQSHLLRRYSDPPNMPKTLFRRFHFRDAPCMDYLPT